MWVNSGTKTNCSSHTLRHASDTKTTPKSEAHPADCRCDHSARWWSHRGGNPIRSGLWTVASVASQRVARIGNPESHTRTETVAHVVNGNEVGMGNCVQSEGGILVSCELWRGIICPPTRGRFARASEPDAGTRRSSWIQIKLEPIFSGGVSDLMWETDPECDWEWVREEFLRFLGLLSGCAGQRNYTIKNSPRTFCRIFNSKISQVLFAWPKCGTENWFGWVWFGWAHIDLLSCLHLNELPAIWCRAAKRALPIKTRPWAP